MEGKRALLGKWTWLVFATMILVIPGIASAEYTMLGRPGDQGHPDLYERYMVFEEGGKIMVYDFGNTLSDDDDIGVLEIDKSSGNSEPVIDGKYIAWIRDRKDIYVYDMGEDEIINSNDLGMRKLNTFDTIKGRQYTIKNRLGLSGGILIWEDFDSGNKDSDIRGYDLNIPGDALDSIDDKHHIIVSDEKSIVVGPKSYIINEFDPFAYKERILYVSDYIDTQAPILPAQLFTEAFSFSLSNHEKTMLSNNEDACSVTNPSSDIEGNVFVWVEYCHPYYKIVINNQKMQTRTVFKEALVSEVIYHHPMIYEEIVYFVEEDASSGMLSIGNNAAGNIYFDINKYILAYEAQNPSGTDISVIKSKRISVMAAENIGQFSTSSNSAGGYFVFYFDESDKKISALSAKSPYDFSPLGTIESFPGISIQLREKEPKTVLFKGVTYSMQVDEYMEEEQVAVTINGAQYTMDREKTYFINGIPFAVDRITNFPGFVTSAYFSIGIHIDSNNDVFSVGDGKGGAIVGWTQKNPNGIYAKFMGTDGKTYPQEPIKVFEGNTILNVSIVSDKNNGAIFVWSSEPLSNEPGWQMTAVTFYARFLRSDGTLEPNDPILISGHSLELETNEEGAFIYQGYDYKVKLIEVISDKEARVQISSGGTETIKNLVTGETYGWSELGLSPRDALFNVLRIDYKPTGISSIWIVVDNWKKDMSITTDGDGGIFFNWISISSGYWRVLRKDFKLYPEDFRAFPNYQRSKAVNDGRGGWIFAFSEYRPTEGEMISSQFLSSQLEFSPDIPLKIAKTEDSDQPEIVSDGRNGAIIAWDKNNACAQDQDCGIYMSFVRSDATVEPQSPIWLIRHEQTFTYSDMFSMSSGTDGGGMVAFRSSGKLILGKDNLNLAFFDQNGNGIGIDSRTPFKNQQTTFRRGDVDADERYTMGDAVKLLNYLFTEEQVNIPCIDAADVDDDGRLTLGDAVFLLNFLFTQGSKRPPLPYPQAGPDLTEDSFGCDKYPR